jgi:hypothetical protein
MRRDDDTIRDFASQFVLDDVFGSDSLANPLWGAPRIHGELLKLGMDVGQTSVAKYMARARRGPSRGVADLSLQSR